MAERQLIVDISSLCRWTGSPTGMIRAEHAIASYILEHKPGARFSFYDSNRHRFVEVRREWVSILIGYSARLLEQEHGLRRIRKRWWPGRRILFLDLETKRIRSGSALIRKGLDAAQRIVCVGKKLPFDIHDRRGNRLDLVRYEAAIADEISFQRDDEFVLASSDWWHKTDEDMRDIATLAADGVNLTAVCYDILPLIRPEWFGEPAGSGEDIKRFRIYWLTILPLAKRIVVNSERVRQDVERYCADNSIRIRNLDIVPLGAEPPPLRDHARRLPPGIEAGKFVLYVSTVEPRKNHVLLLRCWRMLLDRGVPQQNGYKLVIVGRAGWRTETALAQMRDPAFHSGTVVHLEQIDDDLLDSLYAGCAFCVYPSEYEGFGLPIVEAFQRGKAVIASNGGSLPEVVGTLSPLLNPHDVMAWVETLARWIADPSARREYEQAIAGQSHVRSWSAVGDRLIELIEAD